MTLHKLLQEDSTAVSHTLSLSCGCPTSLHSQIPLPLKHNHGMVKHTSQESFLPFPVLTHTVIYTVYGRTRTTLKSSLVS